MKQLGPGVALTPGSLHFDHDTNVAGFPPVAPGGLRSSITIVPTNSEAGLQPRRKSVTSGFAFSIDHDDFKNSVFYFFEKGSTSLVTTASGP